MQIDGKQVRELRSESKCSPVVSMGAHLDFYRDLLNGELDREKDYRSPSGVIGMQQRPMRYWAALEDGEEVEMTREELTREEFERLKGEA